MCPGLSVVSHHYEGMLTSDSESGIQFIFLVVRCLNFILTSFQI